MLVHPQFSPAAFSIGDFAVHWYGLMYLIGFAGGLGLGVLRARRPGSGWRAQQVWDMTAYIIAGVIIGGRLGYCLFYNFAWYVSHPLEIFFVWQGGMSFHGGLLGVAAGVWLFARISKRSAIAVAERAAFRRGVCARAGRPPAIHRLSLADHGAVAERANGRGRFVFFLFSCAALCRPGEKLTAARRVPRISH